MNTPQLADLLGVKVEQLPKEKPPKVSRIARRFLIGSNAKPLCTIFGGVLLTLGGLDGLFNWAPHVETDKLLVAGAGLMTVGATGKKSDAKQGE